MRFVFHTHGNADVGMGHVYRSLALYRYLVSSNKLSYATFVVADGSPGTRIVEKNFGGKIIVQTPDTPPCVFGDVMVIDRLPQASGFYAACRGSVRYLVVFDDTGPGRWQADIAVNALYRGIGTRPLEAQTKELEGLKYLIVDPALSETPPRCRDNAVSRVLLTQGGSDTYGLTPRLAAALSARIAKHPGMRLHVHIGPAFRFHDELDKILHDNRDVLEIHQGIDDMPSFLAGMDLAVTAGGVMSCELAALGVPCVMVTGEEKELETMDALAAAGAGVNVGSANREGAVDDVCDIVDGLVSNSDRRTQMSDAGRRAVDGNGLARIAEAIGELAEKVGA